MNGIIAGIAVCMASAMLLSCAAEGPQYEEEAAPIEQQGRDTGDDMDGIYITDLKYRPHGMAMFPFYTIRRLSDSEFEIGISTDEFSWDAIEGVKDTPFDTYYLEEVENPFADMHSSRTVASHEEIEKLSADMMDAGLMGMDGYDYHRELGPGVVDGGGGFRLAAVLSDGTTLASSSTNAYPASYSEVSSILLEFFEEHSDFSRRYPRVIPDSAVTRICIQCGSMFGGENSTIPYVKFEIHRGWRQWSVVIADNYGSMLGEKTRISDYDYVNDPDAELPFDELMGLISELGIIGDNPTETGAGGGIEQLLIQVGFENGQEILYNTNILPEGYGDFKEKAMDFALGYYRKVRG